MIFRYLANIIIVLSWSMFSLQKYKLDKQIFTCQNEYIQIDEFIKLW